MSDVYGQVPLEILRALAPIAEKMGIADDLPGITRIAPTLDCSKPIRALALELGQLLSRQNIFLRGDNIVTVDPETGKIEPMRPTRFCGWVEEFCAFKPSGRSQRARDSLSREEAGLILDQDIFKASLRPLDAVHQMRLPVRRASGKIEFLEPGYDAGSRIYTIEKIKYDMDWDISRANKFLCDYGAEYPWSWPDEAKAGDLFCSRDWAVHLFAMVGTYCRAMFPPGTPRPMITYIGNQPGTGKSTLVSMALIPVFGVAGTVDLPRTDERVAVTLETIARTMQPYAFFDDVRYGIDSAPLNRFVTASEHSGRCMGGNDAIFSVPAVTQVFATGNGLKITPDLFRRSLVCSLFLPGDVKGRSFKRYITSAHLAETEVRAGFLAAMNAIVRNYIGGVEEYGAESLPYKPQPLPSFEEYSSLIATIVMAAGHSDPLTPPEISPNEDEDEMRDLLIKAASQADGADVFDRKQLVELAREHGLLESLVGSVGDGELDSRSMKSWGRKLQAWRGRELLDERGRRFRFGHKRQKRGATYPLTFIS